MQSESRRSRGPTAALAIFFAALLLFAAGVLAWAAWKRDLAPLTPPGTSTGSLVSVVLVNGQVYYGNLAAATAREISLDNVYYVQTDIDPAANQRNNRLVRRQRADWHAPVRMTIAADKIMMIEQVGAGSRLQLLIEQDSASATPTR